MTIDPRPIDRSVLTEQVNHRSELLWNPGGQDPPSTLNCRCRHEELTCRDPMVDERVIAIVRLLGLERLHMVPSIKLDHALEEVYVVAVGASFLSQSGGTHSCGRRETYTCNRLWGTLSLILPKFIVFGY